MITEAILTIVAPNNKNLPIWVEALSKILPKYDITSNRRIAAFLAQTAHESNGFTAFRENLNYSSKGLLDIWPKRFTQETAEAYARNPEKIANKVYANRMGNGSEKSGDGWKFRGRGLIQTTGRSNYTKLSVYLGKSLDETIAYCETVEGAIESACFFWQVNELNKIADTGDMTVLTKRVNGGDIGLSDRIQKYKKLLIQLEKKSA